MPRAPASARVSRITAPYDSMEIWSPKETSSERSLAGRMSVANSILRYSTTNESRSTIFLPATRIPTPSRPLAVYVGHRRSRKRERDFRARRTGLGHGVGPRPVDAAAPGPTAAVPDGRIIVVVDARWQNNHRPGWLARGQRGFVQIRASLIQPGYVEIGEFGFRCGTRLQDFAQRLRLQMFGGRRLAPHKIADAPLLKKRQRFLHSRGPL